MENTSNSTNGIFTTGQFAKLHNINKRTLHYYDEIGLFSPAYKGENDYRFYTYLQSSTLEMILTLRELNMSIEEISEYIKNPSEEKFRDIITLKTAQIDDTLKRLKEIRQLLTIKRENLDSCNQSSLNRFEIKKYPKEYLLLSKNMKGTFDQEDYGILVEHAQSSPSHRLFNKSYGCMISTDKIKAQDFDNYDFFFTKIERNSSLSGVFIKPAGNYICAYCKGEWDKLPDTYRNILEFASKNGLTLKGFAYEEGMNEMAIQSMEQYVTRIMVQCE